MNVLELMVSGPPKFSIAPPPPFDAVIDEQTAVNGRAREIDERIIDHTEGTPPVKRGRLVAREEAVAEVEHDTRGADGSTRLVGLVVEERAVGDVDVDRVDGRSVRQVGVRIGHAHAAGLVVGDDIAIQRQRGVRVVDRVGGRRVRAGGVGERQARDADANGGWLASVGWKLKIPLWLLPLTVSRAAPGPWIVRLFPTSSIGPASQPDGLAVHLGGEDDRVARLRRGDLGPQRAVTAVVGVGHRQDAAQERPLLERVKPRQEPRSATMP